MKRPTKKQLEEKPELKEKWEKYLEAESIEQRTKRVLEPRITRLFKEMTNLEKAVKSPRYSLDFDQQTKLADELTKKVRKLLDAIEEKKVNEEPYSL